MSLPWPNLLHQYAERLVQSSNAKRNADEIADDLDRVVRGRNAEQEFAALLSWLGKVLLVHPLDQQFSPPRAKARYAVPDLLAVFESHGQPQPFLIEVKTTRSKVASLVKHEPRLKISGRDISSLRGYSNAIGIPLLIAWKNSAFGAWSIFEVRHLKKTKTNYSIGLFEALQQSLMCELAGDFSFVFREQVGLTIKAEIEDGSSTYEEGRRAGFTATVIEAFVTDGHGTELKSMGAVWPLFMTVDVPLQQEIVGNRFTTIIKIPEGWETAEFLHRSLIGAVHMAHSKDKPINWNEIRLSDQFPFSAQRVGQAISSNDASPFISSVIRTRPKTAIDYK